MSIAALGYISNLLDQLGIDYELGQWSSGVVPDPYFVGEYSELEPNSEDGLIETTFMLTGTGTNYLALEQAKENIKQNIEQIAILPNGNGIAIFYAGALTVPVEDGQYQRIQINLVIQEWSVN